MKYYYFSFVSDNKNIGASSIKTKGKFFPVVEVLRELQKTLKNPQITSSIEISEVDYHSLDNERIAQDLLNYIRKDGSPNNTITVLSRVENWAKERGYTIACSHTKTGIGVRTANGPHHFSLDLTLEETK